MSPQRWAASSWWSGDLHSAHQHGVLVDGLGVVCRMSFAHLPTFLWTITTTQHTDRTMKSSTSLRLLENSCRNQPVTLILVLEVWLHSYAGVSFTRNQIRLVYLSFSKCCSPLPDENECT